MLKPVVAALTSLLWICPPRDALGGTAHIFVGSGNASFLTNMNRAILTAQSQFLANGYFVVIHRDAGPDDVIARLNDTATNAVAFFAHGYSDGVSIDLPRGLIKASRVESEVSTGRRAAIKVAFTHSCFQGTRWSTVFPNANFRGWEWYTTTLAIRYWQYWHGKGLIMPKSAPTPGTQSTLRVDPRIDAVAPLDYSAGEGAWRGRLASPGELPWRMDPALALAFGDQTFNVVVRGQALPAQGLGGFRVGAGRVVEEAPDGYPAPGFDYEADADAFAEALGTTDLLPSIFNSGRIRIVNNTTGRPPQTLFEGACALLLGFRAIHASAVLWTLDRPRPGARVSFTLSDSPSAGLPYVMAASLGHVPGLPIGTRRLPLNVDALFLLSLTPGLPLFEGFTGTLDARGQGPAALLIPGDPLLAGIGVYLAFATLDPGAPQGLRSVSSFALARITR